MSIKGSGGFTLPGAYRFPLPLAALILVLAGIVTGHVQAAAQQAAAWTATEADGRRSILLYFFHSETCPHCIKAGEFLPSLQDHRPWLAIRRHSVASQDGEALFVDLMGRIGQAAEGVPTFIFCGRAIVGFDGPDGIGRELGSALDSCHEAIERGVEPTVESADPDRVAQRDLDLPLIGKVAPQALSLPLVTVLLAALDAFNPCAFFVLLFLLSLMVNARSQARMALVGGVFVAISGVMYFLFMAAWLNLFLVLRSASWISLAAGLVAIAIGLVGVKDYFVQAGPTLSISETHKDNLFARMRGLLSADRMVTLLVGTTALAIAANTYELLCTSGFPMVFTRILTLHDLPSWLRYGYLALYNVIYVLPLAAIVAVFVATMGRRKLTEREGRTLKLISGMLMLFTGLVLAIDPALFLKPVWIVAVLAGAVAAAIALATAFPGTGRKEG